MTLPDVPQFREDLSSLQEVLRRYTKMLSGMASVEDLTDMEDTGESYVANPMGNGT